jgi:serine/threonine-protein kinase
LAIEPGTQLGIYEITGTLGAGGMGEVYRARDTKLERDVAIKTLPAGLADDKDRLARFEREAKLLASLNHAHIASVYGLDEHEGTLYIAMELVEGETLEERLKGGALPVEDALRLALQIAEALEAAHEKGVVHRDLKPANVMVDSKGVVKVLDFGLAKAFMGDPNEASPAHSPALSVAMTQQGLVLGTAGYMSPEQASGQGTDQRADVWAFGVVLYEMLTGLPLFSGESVPHILADVLRADPDWERLPKNLHPRILQALERCLEKKPRSRYAGIADARTDLEVALRDPDGIIVPSRVRAEGQSASQAGSRKVLPWAAGIVLASMAGYGAWSIKPSEPQTVMHATDRLAEGQEFMLTIRNVLDIAADGSQFVVNLAEQGLSLRSMDGVDLLPIPGTNGFQRAMPALSPDGRSVAYLTGGGTDAGGVTQLQFVRIPITGGAARALATVSDSTDPPFSLSWAVDGYLYYTKSDGIWRLPENGGTPEIVVEAEPTEVALFATLLPGEEWVLYSVNQDQQPMRWDTGEIFASSLTTGERRLLYSGGSAPRYVPTGQLVYMIGTTLYALPFDPATLEVTGGPIPVLQGVLRDSDSGVAQYRFSDNGTLIYVPGELMTDTAGLRLSVITPNSRAVESFSMPAGVYADPRVSPDARWAAFTSTFADGNDIAVFDLGGNSTPRRLTFGGQSRYPAWSADSSRVAYQSTRDGTASLYWQLADGSGGDPVRLTTAAEGEAHIADSFSPDGSLLAYTIQGENGASIWTLDLATGESEPLIAMPGQSASQAVFSPDGRWIAYQSTETGLDEVFVQPFPPTGAKFQLPVAAQNHHPGWSAEGRTIYYFPGIGQSASVGVTTEGGFSFGAVESIVDLPMNSAPATRRQYDVMPDGSGLLGFVTGARGSAAGESARINIVWNWFTELERLMPRD